MEKLSAKSPTELVNLLASLGKRLAALLAGDFAAARASIREHLDDSRERLIHRLNECGGQI